MVVYLRFGLELIISWYWVNIGASLLQFSLSGFWWSKQSISSEFWLSDWSNHCCVCRKFQLDIWRPETRQFLINSPPLPLPLSPPFPLPFPFFFLLPRSLNVRWQLLSGRTVNIWPSFRQNSRAEWSGADRLNRLERQHGGAASILTRRVLFV